jgi:lysine-specific histone demethylase 1
VPLGVLKASSVEREADQEEKRLSFQPPLPFLKRDAIESVGFGLLNKVYLQFPFPFWRKEELVGTKYAQFGNASGVHPHHYMFLDVGKILEGTVSSPAILMSLISGREATMCERLSDELLIEQVMDTLKTLFSNIEVPSPITFKVTRWGSDEFSRGCYTFLTPGTTDQDFGVLQTPVNGNGDSLLLEGSETMRLFFAGEHTTALHPSMAHGALREY